MIDCLFGSIYFLPCSNSLLGIATSHIGLIRSLYCSVFKEPSLFKRLDYFTTFVEVCQLIFLKSFSLLFRTGPLHQRRVLYYHIHCGFVNRFFEFFMVQGSGFRVVVAASLRSRAQVAAVLAFVISHTTFLAAQDDETGRCPKVSG